MPAPIALLAIAAAAAVALGGKKAAYPGGVAPPGGPVPPSGNLVDPSMPDSMKPAILAQLSTSQNPEDLFNLSIQLGAMGFPIAAQSALAMCNFWRQKAGLPPIAYPAHPPYPSAGPTSTTVPFPNGSTPGSGTSVAAPPGSGLPPVNGIPPSDVYTQPPATPPVPGYQPPGPTTTTVPDYEAELHNRAVLVSQDPRNTTTVKAFQSMYNAVRAPSPMLVVDGKYGPKTATAAKAVYPGAPNALSSYGGGGGYVAPPPPADDTPPPPDYTNPPDPTTYTNPPVASNDDNGGIPTIDGGIVNPFAP